MLENHRAALTVARADHEADAPPVSGFAASCTPWSLRDDLQHSTATPY